VLVGAVGLIAGQWQSGRADKRAEGRLHEQWLRDRRADAYVELLSVAEKCGQWVTLTHPMIDWGATSPPLPSPDEQGHAEAVLRAFASAAVRACWHAWRETLKDAIEQDREIQATEEARGTIRPAVRGADTATLKQHFEDVIRVSERETRKRLGAAVFADLKIDSASPHRFWQRTSDEPEALMGADR